MPNKTSMRGAEKNVQDWINLICGVLFVMGVAALAQFAEWEEWIALIVGALVVIAPWALGFATIHAAMWACVVLGVIVVLSAISEIWSVHHSAAIAG